MADELDLEISASGYSSDDAIAGFVALPLLGLEGALVLLALTYGGVVIPSHMEVTFLRRDRVQITDRPLRFPHPLDHDCNPAKASLVLPSCWY